MLAEGVSRNTAFRVYALAALAVASFYLLAWQTQVTNFPRVILLYLLPFISLWGILRWSDDQRDFFPLSALGIAIRFALIFALPALSDDFYRFVWDGRLMEAGLNPYSHLPSELIAGNQVAGLTPELFAQLNSKEYFSVYPPFLQWIFWLGCKLSPHDLNGAVMGMKAVTFLAEVGTILLLPRLARSFGLSRKSTLLYTLNPLVIIELSANLHFEVLMIFFLAASLFLLQKKILPLAAVAFSLAVGAKLIPLMFMPFLLKRLGWQKALLFGLLVGLALTVQFAPYFDLTTLKNFFTSVNLYFQKFEFNASIYYLISKPLWFTGINLLLGRIFPLLIAALILWQAWREKETIAPWASWAVWMLFCLSLYYFLASTVHPWYITTFVFLAAVSRWRFPILWSFLIPFTYLTYHEQSYQESWLVIGLEYLILFAFVWYEVAIRNRGMNLSEWVLTRPRLRSWLKKTIPPRLKIKQERILKHLSPGENTLDIGTGHGGIALVLGQAGIPVQTVDVKDISLFEEIRPVIYDGKRLPFADSQFNCALLITVLHHTPDPEAVLREALRVAPKVVIMEDIYHNELQKELTFFTDSLVNLEFEGHPHTNKNDAQWRQLFEKLGLQLTFREDFRTLVFFRQVIYVVER
ncbi:MAG: methyltransferase domain-containing protein [Bacteroidia bacterium]|nr:methyltransferase domain-containing protein [Bacteroidia bacterium]